MNNTVTTTIKGPAERKPSLLTLILLISFGSTATVLNTPAMPAMLSHFHLGSGIVQWFVTIFVLAYAVAPLIYGPITHRFGRKNTIYSGVFLSVLGAIICLLTASTQSWALMLLTPTPCSRASQQRVMR